MKLNNGTHIEISKSWYNKACVQEDRITYIVDTSKNYPIYNFSLAKKYFDIEEKPEVVKSIINDLQSTISELQQLLQREKDEFENKER